MLLLSQIIFLIAFVFLFREIFTFFYLLYEEEIKDFLWELDYYYGKFKNFFRNIYYGIENIIEWLPVIWRDRSWDYHYLLIIIHKKFEQMEDLHKNYGHFVRSDKTAKELMIVKNLTKRLIDDNYSENALVNYYKKYGEEPRFEFVADDINPKFYRLISNTKEKQDKEYMVASKHAEIIKLQDLELLCHYIKRKMFTWWN